MDCIFRTAPSASSFSSLPGQQIEELHSFHFFPLISFSPSSLSMLLACNSILHQQAAIHSFRFSPSHERKRPPDLPEMPFSLFDRAFEMDRQNKEQEIKELT
jgi:hypothetical protein